MEENDFKIPGKIKSLLRTTNFLLFCLKSSGYPSCILTFLYQLQLLLQACIAVILAVSIGFFSTQRWQKKKKKPFSVLVISLRCFFILLFLVLYLNGYETNVGKILIPQSRIKPQQKGNCSESKYYFYGGQNISFLYSIYFPSFS